MPPYRRDSPAWLAASLNEAKEIVVSTDGIPGSTRPKHRRKSTPKYAGSHCGMTVEKPKASLPVNRARTVALARENTACPEKYPGNGGVRLVPGLYGVHCSPRMFIVG